MSRLTALTQVSTNQVVTANAPQSASAVPTDTFLEAEAYLIVSATSGTTPTVTPLLESSPDGVNWFTLVTGTAITANGNYALRATGNTGRQVRLNYTGVGGTTPSFTVNAYIHTKKQAV